ncbi:VOC family protein [Kocuria sp. CPCC 204721]
MKLGAREANFQSSPEPWCVMLDPMGHLFCLSAVRPD